MSKKEKEKKDTPVTPEAEAPEAETPAEEVENTEAKAWEEKYNAEHDSFLRLAAEFDNFRKRTAKEKEAAYGNGRGDTIKSLLPVYDNLARALKQETGDAAFKKGVELTMTELMKILGSLGVEVFGQEGDLFDPNLHNAVMHADDDTKPENTIIQVFQQGFKLGDKVIRFAMVQVAN